jgi:exodeoxyribonuclease-5
VAVVIPALLSSHQQGIARGITRWLKSARQVCLVHGLAGTGKTTLVVTLGKTIGDVLYAAPTGKAAAVLRARGGEDATTLHRRLYHPPQVKVNDSGRSDLTWYRRTEKLDTKLIIADECSMIDEQLGYDLLATRRKILVTGDPMQLPPVGGRGFFDHEADFVLKEIHRQAADSQPLRVASAIRAGERINPVPYDREAILAADMVIVALNSTRRTINKHWRPVLACPAIREKLFPKCELPHTSR